MTMLYDVEKKDAFRLQGCRNTDQFVMNSQKREFRLKDSKKVEVLNITHRLKQYRSSCLICNDPSALLQLSRAELLISPDMIGALSDCAGLGKIIFAGLSPVT